MQRRQLWLLLLLVPLVTLPGCVDQVRGNPRSGGAPAALEYPETRTVDQVDTYHGVEIKDPYRWMEEDSAETRSWIEAQNDLLVEYVEGVPQLESLEAELARLRQVDRVGIPVRRGRQYFFTRTDAGRKEGVLYAHKGLDGKPRKILDFAEMIDDPTHKIGGVKVSPDGKYAVWSSQSQSRWGWLDIARVESGERLDERLMGIASSNAIWTHDSHGFFYTTYGDYAELESGNAEARPRILYHRVGTKPQEDTVVYEREDRPSMLFSPKISDDGRYLVLGLSEGSSAVNSVVYKDLKQRGAGFKTLIAEADARYVFEGNVGSRFFFRTTLDAPRSRLVAIDLGRPDRTDWVELIPEREMPLNTVSHIGERLVVATAEHARPIIEVWTTDGSHERTLELPTIGLVGGFGDDADSPIAFYRLNSLHDPGTVYRVDVRTGKSEVQVRSKLAHDPDDYEIRQVFYESKDGTRIPMFLAHRKDVPLRDKRPLFMYGYGHGGWVAFPWFQPHLIAWMNMGGIYALPGIRGGGEYGKEWQDAGTLLNKPNTIDDFIAAAEWLIEHEYTTPDGLVANGGSASGVLPAAAIVRRPDLFGAAVIDFPFLDMLRYDEFTTIKGWTRGYGSSDVAEEFEVLRSYSPLHTLEPGACYPAILTIVGEKDTSTVPMHGYKFTAAFQAAQGCDQPGLLKFIPGAGHYSYGATPAARARTEAEILAFLMRTLDFGGTS